MTDIRMRLWQQGATSRLLPAGSVVTWVASRAFTFPDRGLMLPAPIPIPVPDAASLTVAGVQPCNGFDGWAWQVTITLSGAMIHQVTVLVPQSTTPVDFETLQAVDPDTLDPAPNEVPAWEAGVLSAQAAAEAARDQAQIYAGTTVALQKATVLDAAADTSGRKLSAMTINESFPDIRRFGGVGDGTTDNTTAFNAAMAALAPTGGKLFFPAGVWRINGVTNVVPGNVTLLGCGIDYSDPTTAPPARRSVIRAGATMDRLIQLGSNTGSSTSDQTGASVQSIVIDGATLADKTLRTAGRRNHIDNAFILWGASVAVDMVGQNGEITGYSVIQQNNVGDCVRIGPTTDNKIFPGTQIRQAGPDGALVHLLLDGASTQNGINAGDFLMQGCHLWLGQNGVSAAGKLIWIELKNGAQFHSFNVQGNILEGCDGDQVVVDVDSTSVMRNLSVQNNTVFNGLSLPDITYSFVKMTGAGSIVNTIITGNNGKSGNATSRYKSILHNGGAGARSRVIVDQNVFQYAQYAITQDATSTLAVELGTNIAVGSDSVTRRTHDSGSSTFTGDGTKNQFFIPTMIGTTIRRWSVTPRSAGAAIRNWFVDISATQLVINIVDNNGAPAAPVSGAILTFMWEAWE